MTAQAVRRQIQTYTIGGNIDNLNAINRAPIGVDDPEQFLSDGPDYGATSYIWLESSAEVTLTSGAGPNAPGSWRMVKHNAALIFDWFTLGVATNDDVWADALDAMIEDIKTLYRADPKFGDATIIFAAANEFPDTTASSVTVVMGEPQDVADADAVTVHGAVVFPVYEQVAPGQ